MTGARGSVTVSVPATSANLGTGFDALGVALELRNRVKLTVVDEDAPERSRAEDHLVAAAYERACAEHGITPLSVACTVEGEVPESRGLGSSATCIVGAVVAAGVLHDRDWDATEHVRLATLVEGHPDNVAPAVLGGVVVSAMTGRGVDSLPVPVPEGSMPDLLLLVPDHPVSTAAARGALPDRVPHGDAVHNAARSALLVAALATGRVELLGEAMDDRLHQPYREALVPGVADIHRVARESGAAASCVSGAGPTLLVVAPAAGTAVALQAHLTDHPWGWELHALPVDRVGARVLVSSAG
ncbi:homoserine kinase [Kytococcus sp. Marseille-QA3725]